MRCCDSRSQGACVQESIRAIKEFESLPFYCGVRKSPYRQSAIPDFLPFALGIRDSVGLIVQVPNETVQQAVTAAYESEGLFLTAPVDESPLTRWRAEECLNVMVEIAGLNVEGKRLLEIGCQTGYLLSELRKRGASVRGCEPGPSGVIARARYGLDVDQDFFGPLLYGREFDIVVHLTVLEHMFDPLEFLHQTTAALNPGGEIFVGVPNCETQLRTGDPGMLLHEHWSYFTPGSLVRVLQQAGFSDLQCHSNERVIYTWGRWIGGSHSSFPVSDDSDLQMAGGYVSRLSSALRKVDGWVKYARQERLRVGLYGASTGAANILRLLDWGGVSVDLFDGEPAKHGCYLPGCELPICPPDDLMENMPDKLLILPINFTEAICRFLREELGLSEHVQVDSLAEMLKAVDGVP